MPVPAGKFLSSAENVSSPPADAPIPTIGNDSAAAGPSRVSLSLCIVTGRAVCRPARVLFISVPTSI
jgi:hypothetical protein